LQKRTDRLFYACGTAKLEIFEIEEKARRAEESRGAIHLTLRKERERMGIPQGTRNSQKSENKQSLYLMTTKYY
jgi:hypothetical protein